jgi:hypothetical protein
MIDLLPEALADALGAVVADVRRECRREIEVVSARSCAIIAELKARIAELEAQVKASLDAGLARLDGAIAGVANGLTIEVEAIEEIVRAEVAKLPPPAAGSDGLDGADGKDGAPGRDGKDGVGVAGALIDRTGSLVVTQSDGAVLALGLVVGRDGIDGKDGAPGRDGKDGAAGLGLEDLSVRQEGERGFVFRMARGELVKEFPVSVPAMIYRGVFRENPDGYACGDLVTHGGSLWHCDAATMEKPGEGSKDWTLAAKRGRDGKDGKNGERGEPGPEGRPGRDLTQRGPDGTKW